MIAAFGVFIAPATAQEVEVQSAEEISQPKAPPNDLIRADKALVGSDAKPDPDAARKTNAVFDQKFAEYKSAMHDIEKLNVEYQSANEQRRQKINEQLSGQVAHARSLVNAMVEAAIEAYRFAPNTNPQVTELLVAVAKYNAVGRQIGPGEPNPQNPDDVYYPIDGGDQYEVAMPIVKVLAEGGADDKQLSIWAFLCAFMANDYDAAAEHLQKSGESGALEDIAEAAGKIDREENQAGLMQGVMHVVTTAASILDEYRGHWAKESEIRAAEAKADDLPRVKLTTTKGEITLELFENEAPQSVANFLTLVKQGFYDGSPFHRVLPKFMAQGGAKDEDGQGGPGYTIRCECYGPDYRRHFRGTLSMAHAGRDTGSSQFFLTFVPTPHLNGKHTAFGRVIEGMEVLADLQRRSPQHQSSPPKADRILKAEVVRDRGHEYTFDKLPGR
jgi:cyclophilin family peptidyl-prolyl cis-trans isomerase